MYARVAGQTSLKAFEGTVHMPNPEKRLPYGNVVKKQEVNGSWSEDFLDSLFTDAVELKREFSSLTDRTSYLTFLVCQYLLRFHPN
jgi:hypothetical protein